MSNIRRQSIISSLVVYFGFALGLLNTYFFTKQGGFTKEQYGLTNIFIAFANIMFSVASLGMPAYIAKFFPYYKSHLKDKNNDQLAWAVLVPCVGFLAVFLAGVFFKNILVDKIFNNSPQLLKYYYWSFLFGFGYTIYMVLEAWAWQQRKSILSNLLKEVIFRLLVTGLILATLFNFIKSFSVFIGFYAFAYLALALFFIMYFKRKGLFHLSFKPSIVTKKFFKKILTLIAFIWSGNLVFNISAVLDSIIIAAVMPNGMAQTAIFSIAQNVTSIMQAPQRAIVSAAIGPLSQAWREKDYKKINAIYHRSSINQLIFAAAIFCLIWLNFDDGIMTFKIQPDYYAAKQIFLFLGIAKIIDMGTGVNAQIIGASTFWKFEFISGLILLALTFPLTYVLTQNPKLGTLGPPIATLISMTIYNAIRCTFLWKKFRMQPFTLKTAYTLLLAAACFFVVLQLFGNRTGSIWLITRSTVFCALFATGALGLQLSPDLQPVLTTVKKRLGLVR